MTYNEAIKLRDEASNMFLNGKAKAKDVSKYMVIANSIYGTIRDEVNNINYTGSLYINSNGFLAGDFKNINIDIRS